MRVRCPDCRGRGHVGGYSRVCKTCHGGGAVSKDPPVPKMEHGTYEAYRGGCRCQPCCLEEAKRASDTPLGRELKGDDWLGDKPDDQHLPRWMTDAHDRCDLGGKVDREPGGGTRLEWPCGALTVIYAEQPPLTQEEWRYRHDLTLTALEAMRRQAAAK